MRGAGELLTNFYEKLGRQGKKIKNQRAKLKISDNPAGWGDFNASGV
jgi:hypothetical protein